MADYLSSFTGQQIDQALSDVAKKINITDIVDDESVGESDTPASSRLVMEAYKAIASINTFNDNKVLRIDTGDQTINGKKTFAALLTLNGGATIPANKVLTLTDKATQDTEAVNFGLLKDHSLSLEDSFGAGITLARLNTGYLKIGLDFSALNDIGANDVITTLPLSTANGNVKISYSDFITRLTASDAFASKVNVSDYNTKMTVLDNAIAARVLITTYNNDLAAVNSAINNRVLTSTYTTKMTQLDNSIAAKVDTSTYNAAITALQTSKVDVTTYNTDMANKVGYTQDGQINVNASSTLAIVVLPKANCIQILATTALADGVTDVWEIFMNNTTVISATNKVKNTSGTVPATFTATISGNNISLVCANGASSMLTVRYKILANF